MACGNGIFSLIFILNSRAEELDVYLADINFKITANAVYNFRQSSIWNRIRKIHYLTSDLFQNIDTNVQYEYILINPPQTPFQSSKSRLDRNGGPVAIAFYEPVLSYFA
jgi:16S rRNA G1207 methylase RsmC